MLLFSPILRRNDSEAATFEGVARHTGMEELKRLRRVGCCVMLLVVGPVVAQTAAPVAPARPLPMPRVKKPSFADFKPVLGMPFAAEPRRAYCAADGTAFFNVEEGAQDSGRDVPTLYSVATSGQAMRVMRKLPPPEWDGMSLVDFFVSEHELVTLLKAEKRDDRGGGNPPREVRYFISLSDHDGDGASLVALDLHFRPLKIARFGLGDYMVLGWDEGNVMPEIAVLKDDGTIRRFIDLDNRRSDGSLTVYGVLKGGEAKPSAKTLQMLEHAFFVPFGNEVLLAQRDSAAPVLIMGPVGEDGRLPMELPGGFLLEDILPTTPRQPFVVKAGEKPHSASEDKGPVAGYKEAREQKMFEVDSNHGALQGNVLTEFVLDSKAIAHVTCAPPHKILELAPEPVANAPADANGDVAMQLVVGSAVR